MRTIVERGDLRSALNGLSSLLDLTNPDAMAGLVRVRADETGLRISASDGVVHATVEAAPGRLEDGGAVLVPARYLVRALAGMEPGEVELETDGDRLRVGRTGMNYLIDLVPGDLSPPPEPEDDAAVVEVDPRLFPTLALRVLHAAAVSPDTGPALRSVWIVSREDAPFEAVAMGPARAACMTLADSISGPFPLRAGRGLPLPRRVLSILRRTLPSNPKEDRGDRVEVTVGRRAVAVRGQGFAVAYRTPMGALPDHAPLFTEDWLQRVEVDTALLRRALKGLGAVDAATVRVAAAGGSLMLDAGGRGRPARASAGVPCTFLEGEVVDPLRVNRRDLIHAVEAARGSDTLLLGTRRRPEGVILEIAVPPLGLRMVLAPLADLRLRP
jgi:DNA polymerase III sliding clamp (beta) subunit (PCNA family)